MRAQAHNRAKFPVRLPLVFLNRFWYNKKTGAAQAAFRYKARVLRPQLFQGWNTVLYGSGQVCAAGRREPCQAGNRAALSGCSRAMQVACPFPYGTGLLPCVLYGAFFRERRLPHVQGALPEIPAPILFRCGGPAPSDPHPAKRGDAGAHCPRLPVHRLSGDGQDHLRQDPGPGGQLPAPQGRRPLRPVRDLQGVGRGVHFGRGGDRRRQQQRRGQHPFPHRGVQLHPGHGKIPGVHHRRGPHALPLGLQRPAKDPGGAPRPRHLYFGHHRGPQAAAHHSVPVPAVRLQAHCP